MSEKIYNNFYVSGYSSGISSVWSVDEENQCLILNRLGDGPASGNVAICVAFESVSSSSFSYGYGTADDDSSLYDTFRKNGGELYKGSLNGANGAVSVSANGPGIFTITFGWYFPGRDHYGQVVGNHVWLKL